MSPKKFSLVYKNLNYEIKDFVKLYDHKIFTIKIDRELINI